MNLESQEFFTINKEGIASVVGELTGVFEPVLNFMSGGKKFLLISDKEGVYLIQK